MAGDFDTRILIPVIVMALNRSALLDGSASLNAVVGAMVGLSNQTGGVVQLDQSTIRYAPGDDPNAPAFQAAVRAYLASPPPLG